MKKRLFALFFGITGLARASMPPREAPALEAQPLRLASGKAFELQVMKGWELVPAAEGLGSPRFMALGPDKRLYVCDRRQAGDNAIGRIHALSDFDNASGRFKAKTVFAKGLRNPNNLAFYQGKLYAATTGKLLRFPFPKGEPQVIATFPDYGLDNKQGGWHLTRTLAFHGPKLYVSVGSSCNACVEKPEEWERATILEMNPDGSGKRIYASGLRNAVGMKWIGGELHATNMGADHLGNGLPQDTLLKIKDGADYGWPHCYEQGGKAVRDEGFPGGVDCAKVPLSLAPLGAHVAPLGFEYFANAADSRLKGYFVIALHGSGNPGLGRGHSVVRVTPGQEPQALITGFLQDRKRWGRPADVLRWEGDSFLFSDDFSGVIYLARKKKI